MQHQFVKPKQILEGGALLSLQEFVLVLRTEDYVGDVVAVFLQADEGKVDFFLNGDRIVAYVIPERFMGCEWRIAATLYVGTKVTLVHPGTVLTGLENMLSTTSIKE